MIDRRRRDAARRSRGAVCAISAARHGFMTDENRKAIGVFDSGVGGLTVLEALRQKLPREDFIYLGDTARVPYGNRTPQTIARYAASCARRLAERDVKALVIACNTASAYALDVLRSTFQIPVFGVIEPVSKMAVQTTKNGNIAVIGTRATIASRCYRRAIASFDPNARVYDKPCPLFVPLVEEGWTHTEPARLIVETYMRELIELQTIAADKDESARNFEKSQCDAGKCDNTSNNTNQCFDTLILGCTHYPVLREPIAEALHRLNLDVALCDCGIATADALAAALCAADLLNKRCGLGKTDYLVTDDPDLFASIGRSFMKDPPQNVAHIDIL